MQEYKQLLYIFLQESMYQPGYRITAQILKNHLEKTTAQLREDKKKLKLTEIAKKDSKEHRKEKNLNHKIKTPNEL